ncbi:MAG TPA: RAMP superfamily CRISPR-associated protein, partial [bacterium]|nr:RAMP superfamily CRISPR-associated protein [bacterium]
LTPLLVGNNTYKVEDADRNVGLPNGLDNKKTIIEPLRLSSSDGRVVIPGTSIKGMLRHSLSALLSTPMERVAEKEYGFRPNMQFGNKLEALPAIITGIKQNGDFEIMVMKNPVFVTQGAGNLNKFDSQLGEKFNSIKGLLDTRRVPKLLPDQNIVNLPHYVFKYFGGIDGRGLFADAFKQGNGRNIYKHLLIPENDFINGKKMTLSKKLFSHYIKTLNFIKNDKEGHSSSRRPNLPSNHSHVESAITEIEKTFNDSNMFGKLVFFVEKSGNDIVTMGHNFRYISRYRDTVLYEDGSLRDCVKPLDEETQKPFYKDGKENPEMLLSAARLLFGYAVDDAPGTKGIAGLESKDKNNFKHLAGRIAINHAVEVLPNGKNGKDDSRFLDKVFFKELGSPKASAVEYYIDQRGNNGQMLKTYGDDINGTNVGELAGRKFYLHQSNPQYQSNDPEEKKSERSSIGRFISKPGTEFKFSIKYKNLRWWELALLKFVVEINKKDVEAIDKNFAANLKTDAPFAHKLGYARPLGLGSIQMKIDNIDKTPPDKAVQYLSQLEFFEKWKKNIFAQWLKIHQFEGRTTCEYRKHPDKDGKPCVFEYHSKIRQHHLSIRKGGGAKITNNIKDIVLKELS